MIESDEKQDLILCDGSNIQEFSDELLGITDVDLWQVDEFAMRWVRAYPELAGKGPLFSRCRRVISDAAIRRVLRLRYNDCYCFFARRNRAARNLGAVIRNIIHEGT